MKKNILSFLLFLFVAMQVQAQQMGLALKLADFCVHVDKKTAVKALKEQGFKKLSSKNGTIIFYNKQVGMGAMIEVDEQYVDYVKFLFPEEPAEYEIDEAATQAGYKRKAREGSDRYYRKRELALYASQIFGSRDYHYGFVITYEP